MSNRDPVIELVGRLPEDTSLPEIAREIEFLAGVRRGLESAERGEGLPIEEVRKLLPQRVTKSS